MANGYPLSAVRKTLTRFTIEREHENWQRDPTGDFSGLLNAVATAVKVIANQASKGALIDVPDDAEQKLDVVSNAVMIGQTE